MKKKIEWPKDITLKSTLKDLQTFNFKDVKDNPTKIILIAALLLIVAMLKVVFLALGIIALGVGVYIWYRKNKEAKDANEGSN